jgi:hypothetical protein
LSINGKRCKIKMEKECKQAKVLAKGLQKQNSLNKERG